MKKKFVRLISAVLSAVMTLTAVPLSAFAEGETHTHDGESNVITTPLDFREKTADENGVGWSWVYDTKTLTLDGVNIQATTDSMSVVTVPDGTEIVLNGENTIIQTDTGNRETYVLSAVNTDTTNCDGTMTISGDGVLNAENRSTDSMARSLGGSIILNGGTVNATGTVKTNLLEIHNDGVLNANATTASFEGVAVNVGGGITVDGNGSLTAVGGAVENEYANNGAILLNSNFGDKISVSENGSITVPEGNAAKVGIYYGGNNGDGMDAEISGGKVTAYGTKYGIYKVNLIMSGTGSVYTTGGSYAIGQTVPTIDEDEFVVKGSTESKASESAVTSEVKLNGGYYEIDGADAKTVVIKPDTEPSIKLGKQIGAVYADDVGNNSYAYFYITEKNFADGAFDPKAEWVISPSRVNIDAYITKKGGKYVCEVTCDEPDLSRQYELRVKSGEVYSNTVTVTVGKPHFALTSRDSQSKYYTNYNGEQKITLRYDVEAGYENQDGLQYNWSSDSKKYDIADLGAVNTVDGVETLVFSDNVPEGSYVIYCDVVYNNDYGEAYTLTERFAFTFEECKHTGGFTDEVCNICHNACDHKNIDTDTGICVCGRQFVATISTDGSAPTGYDTLKDCLDSITADTGNYVKIYQDIEKDSSQKYIVKYRVTLDLNGHRLDDELNINEKNSEDNNGELTLTGTGYINNVYAYSNTTFTIDDNANIEADTFFNNAGTRFTVSDGANVTVRYLAVKESISSEGNATSVKLATGMKITEMLAYDLDNSSPLSENIMLKNLLSDNQMLKYESSSKIIDLYYGASRIIINSKTYGYGTITVVEHTDHSFDGTTGKCTECGKPCEHGGDINTDNGKCSICGKVCGAIVIKADGTAVGYDDLAAAFAEAGNNNGCTLKLFSNYEPSKVIEVSGKFTIDLNGKQCLNSKNIIIGKNATITLTGNSNSSIAKLKVAGGTVSADCSGAIYQITVEDGKLNIYSGEVDSLHIEAGADIALYGGFINDIFNNTGDTILLRSLLADGYAFATKDDSGTLTVANKYDSTISPFENIKLYVVEHKTCSYDKDNPTGKCKECGKPCEHGGDINTDNGICSVCGAVVSVALYTDANGNLHFIKTTDELRNKLGDPNVNGTIKLFGDCSFDSEVGFSGKFTFDFNGHAVITDSNIVINMVINENAVITVAGSQAENASVNFDVKTGGALTLAADYDGSTYVTMNGGKLDVYNGVVSYLNIHKDSEIKLYGGHFRHIVNVTYTSFELGKMLGDGYAYADHTTNSIVNVYNYVLKGEGVGSYSELNVVKHEACSYDKESATGECKECGRSCPHNGNIDIESGVCDICGGVGVVARYTDENGNASLISTADDLHNMLSDTDVSGTIMLFKDYKKTGTTTAYTICKELTIDLNGHNFSYRGVAVDGGKVTLENSGSKQAMFPGIGPSVDNGGTIIVNGDISFDGAISTNDKSTVILNAGTFDGTGFTASGSKTVYNMLGEGKAFFKDDGTLFNANVKSVTSADGKLTIGEHPKHTYNEGKCDCGYVCPHEELNVETGICGKCGYQYAAIIVKDGEIISRYEGKDGVMLTQAFLSANSEENKGCTLGVFKNHINACFDLTSEFDLIVGNNIEITNLNIKGNIKIGSVDGEDGFTGRLNVADGGTLTFDKSCAFTGTLTVGEGTFDCYNANGAKLIIENKSGNVTLHGGRFSGISYTSDDERKNELLVTLLADESAYYSIYSDLINGSLGTLGEGFGYTVVVKEHTHSFRSDGNCMCGRVCPHSDVNIDTGKCTECEYQYAAVIVKDGAVASVYKETEMEAAFEAADSDANTGCTLRVYKNYTGSYTTLSGKFTLWIAKEANVGTLTVSGDITVTGSEKNNSIYGDFNVADGGKLTFDENCGAMGTVSVGAGTFDCYCSLGTTLNINDASSDVILHGGYFIKIRYNGGGDRANAEILTLLAENRMFMTRSNDPIDGSKTLLKDGFATTVLVIPHEDHGYDSTTGKCTICGKRCGHTDVDSKTGVCKTCQHEFVATLTVGDKVTGFDSLSDCLSNTSEDSENYVKIYKNIDDRTTINVNHTVTVDLNGHKLYYIELKVNNDNGAGNLTLTGSEGSYISQVYVCGGRTFKIDSDANINFETIFVEAGARFEVSYGANVTVNTLVVKESLTLYGSTTTSVRLTTGMRIGTLTYDLDRNSGSGNLLLYSLLGEGKALQYDNSGEYVDIYEKFTSKIIRDSFTVVYHYEHSYDKATGKCVCGYVCPHSDVDNKTGVCPTCKYQLTAGISGVGTAKYFDNIDNAFTAALSAENNGCTLTLYKDCELSQNIVIGNATVTVDMNGHSILLAYRIKVNDGGVLYLKNSGENGSIETEIDVNKGGTLINGTADDSRSAVSVFGVTADAAKRVEIYGGSYEGLTVNNGTSGIALYGGSYESINTNDLTDSTPVSALLAKGYAFATLNSVTHLPESIVDGSETNLNPGLENVMVVAHTHTYTETNPKCACGAVLYAKVTSADGTSNKYFDSIEEGLLYADKAENKGCVFTLVARGLLKDKVTLSSGQFTIATATTNNNYVIGPYEGEITIDGADVIAEGDLAIRCNVCVKSGSLTLPEGSGTGFDSIIISGGTVTISEGVSADSYAGADNLSVDKDATDVKLTIGGGTYGNVYFGQLKFKDVLASGVRVISYDNPSDPTAEKTATALLYSDIAEESSLNSNNGTVSYYLVTKCEHKNEDGSYAFNDGVCKYCGSEFAASVSYTVDGSAKTELFGDIYDAFDKANEIGTATITLYKNIENNITDTIAVTGNVTLELNGKKLTTPGFEPYYAIEVKSGKLTVNGSGSIKRAVVRNGGDAEINGGTFSDFRIEDGGNAVINGGQFYSIKVSGEGRNVGQLLADGYAYKSLDGYWSTIAEREKQGIASVNVLEAPIKSASISWVGEEAPVIYRNGEKYLYVNVTYELAVGSRGATYSDFVNGNNRIKDYNLYNKYMVHCYEIGKLAAKDGEVEYYTVLKCNGYEYKSNVLKLTLATCSHPEDSFLYENNGLVICGICDALIEAEVVDADGKSLGYADIESAIKLAQENEGSTVKLMSDGVSSATEFTTVTGGKFTVDFNGKTVFYQFAVSGGDVTFTSSVKQADAETLISGITVNGTDAKVTIDGKIKLGSVTLSSGTLTVNSTDGYIKELSINGGKADIDGAEIDTLVFKGGDLAIRNVTVGSLDINKKATDATEHNIVIESGSFDTITCSDDSDYNIVKALASERRLRGTESGIIYEYSEIESLTEATDITVEKCDHKYANGNIAVDDDYVCYYCNSQIVATVSYTADGSEKTDLFGDICDAFDKANEASTATVTLRSDITGTLEREIKSVGNITLDLNGKKLTVSNEDEYTLTVWGGTFTVKGDGELYDLDVFKGKAVIQGGKIKALTVDGTAVISGGEFEYIIVGGGKTAADLLEKGYAYKSTDDDTWLSIADREKNLLSDVTVAEAPIKSASISWAGGEAPVVYRNGDKYLNVNVTYTLADGSSGVTYSDYVNGNNRSKDSNLYTNYTNVMAHCYAIGKLAAKDGEVEYYTVLKCDGYEYKSNVLKFTLATCSHPEDSFNYENNGWVICGICAASIEAEVVDADGKSLGYADIDSAIKLAQENEGSTVKLISERVPASITVTGGKFTVDFNGKEASYQFAVSGGDVTFTSSAVQDVSNQNLQSGITVNGTDAKVTIDGKIKLGRVRIISGTLTVNSTQGYIKELSIIGGNAVIDDAIIGALQTNGGDTVINCVEADSLSININGSGSLSIVTGTFGSTTCETGLGMAIASGSVVLSSNMNGITVYTYEAIQTMTKTDRIFVEKCSHKDGKGSYVLDGSPCPYCNKEIVATVSYTAGGEETDLFSDIYDAFERANEAGTATVTLYKDITDDITDTIAVTGNVTVELNGKKLSTSGFDPYYTIEVKSGKLTVNGSGTINRVVVRNGGDAEINGGIFSDFRIEDGGNAVINGGKFNSIKVSGEGRNVGQLLADGYAYKNFDGFWSTVAEREKQGIASVNVLEAPIKSATITANDESPIIYRNGRKTASFTADVTYTGNETLYVTGCLIDGTVIKEKTDLSGNRYYLFSGEVDKAVAEDGEIQYYCIFTYDGYDYKSNAVTLTVATCQHPVESVKCDDNGYVCGICDRALTASVELSDGTLSYYGNWNDAISAAQESEGCTLKLLNYSWLKDNETFDISKGRFTVDLNKNDSSGPFAFNVKGGDITFTALKKASISFTGVTVSGENANVLIDSKATLNYLVVNSGKVSVDGAFISAITINGGDTVINDVDAGLLSEEGNGSVNISIVSGRFESVVFDEYTFGKAIASGSRIRLTDADGGKIYKYADIQNKGNAGVIVVEKCDHKDENDSYKLDGKPCPYCNEEIVATVSYTTADGENTDLFSDIYDAFEKANEVGTATITLYKDIENSEFTRYITVTGNVTLALNGKKLGYSFVSRTVEVSDGGMLTVDGDGKMMVPIIVNENAKLTVNGGEIATVMIYKDGDAVIGGGFIEDLDVNGNVKLSGGKFYNIEIANGSLESVLADGYAYKVDGGAWLSIAERAKEKYYSWNNEDKPVNVEEAPIKSATLSTKINKLYRNSNANPTVKFNPALAHGSLNDSDASMRYGINSYESGDTVYNSLSTLVTNTKLSADEIIDKAGNSNVAEIYYIVTFDGYEVKTNTVCIDLVDCDHSQVVDPTADKETAGNITEPTYCEICESKFNAKITKGDDVRYYNDLDEAVKDAQKSENEGCTLYPLYNKNGYGGQLVITEGNFTLKYAVRTAFSNPVVIKGNAKLKVTGRCAVTSSENPDAFTVNDGDVTFDGLATGSNVTINGGNVTMSANNINCLTINGGNVSISSGGFAEIVTTVSDKVIADYIDHGFWVQDRGTKEWIDIYSLSEATASSTNVLSVRLCPMQIIKPIDTVYYTNGYYPDGIPSLQINAEPWYSNEVNAKVAYQWIAIDENGNETEIEGATDRKLSLENLTTGRYYCRLTYSNAATAGVSMKSDVVTATITECEHSGGKATCTERAKCEICGAEYGETKPHSYAHIKAPEYLKSAATCTAKAVYYTSCTECGQSSKGTADEETFEYGNALGHKYGAWVSNGDGTHTRVCANDNKHTETKDCHGGKATCTAKAICEDCGKAYGKMTAHTFTKTVSEKYLKSAATCTAKAVYYTSCADCGLSSKGTADEETFEYGNALGHKYGKWVSNGDGTHTRVCANDSTHTETKDCHGGKATCTAKAICEDCGKAYGEMTAHTFTKTVSEKYLKSAATCTAKAVYYTSCADCGLSSKGTADEETFEYGNALGHKYGKWVSNGDGTHTRVCANDNKHTETKACHGGKATCTAKAICEDCGAEYGEMTAHTFTAKSTVSRYLKRAATCTEKSEYYVSCAGCGLSSKGTASEAVFTGSTLGHSLTEWNVITEVTCTTNGTQERHCTRCDYKQTRTIVAKGHSYGLWNVTKKVGCVTDGEQSRECSVCGNKETKTIAATGVHSYGSWKVTKAATCTTTGTKVRSCSGCGAKETVIIQPTGHKYVESIVKPTYTEKGYTLHKCSECGTSYKSSYTDKLVLASVSGVKLAGRAADALRVSWNRNTSADGYIVEIYKDGAWARAGKITTDSTTDFKVTGLNASTFYKFRVRAYKMSGNTAVYSDYGSTLTARTNPSVIKGAKLAGRAADALRISWDRNTSADGYIVEIYKDGAWSRAVKTTNNSITTYRAEGLKASTVYKLRVRAYKMDGTAAYYGNYSAEVTARTNPSVIKGAKLAGRAADALRVSWDRNTSADGYIVEVYKDGAWSRAGKITTDSTTDFRVTGLKASTVYKLRVRAYKMSGTVAYYGNYSAEVTARTNPSVMTGVKIGGTAKDALRINWSKNTSAQGYIVEMAQNGKWVRVAKITDNSTTTFRKAGLAKNTSYRFRVCAYHMSGSTPLYGTYVSVSGKTAAN